MVSIQSLQPIQVLVVDDSAFMRRAIKSMLDKDPGFKVVGTANNGLRAIEEAKRLRPDAITLDIEMPEMDGLTALRQIRRVCDASVLMCSSLTTEGSSATLAALRAGASDFLAKDQSQFSLGVDRLAKDLLSKIRVIVQERRETRGQNALDRSIEAELPTIQKIPQLGPRQFDMLLIGSSTGGPPVLETILSQLPGDLAVPVLIAQHMPLVFTKVMSERLNSLSRLEVLHAESGMPMKAGQVYISPGGQHLRVRRAGLGRYQVEVSPEPREALYKPAVNELFRSAAEVSGSRVLAVVLTGMGEDGLIGGRSLHEKGATLLAQDHASCVVYGMPKAVTQAGLVLANLNPSNMVKALSQLSPSSAAS